MGSLGASTDRSLLSPPAGLGGGRSTCCRLILETQWLGSGVMGRVSALGKNTVPCCQLIFSSGHRAGWSPAE